MFFRPPLVSLREMNSTTLHIVTFATPQIAMLLSLWESQLCAVARMDRAASYAVHLHTVGAASAHGDTGAISVQMLMRARLLHLEQTLASLDDGEFVLLTDLDVAPLRPLSALLPQLRRDQQHQQHSGASDADGDLDVLLLRNYQDGRPFNGGFLLMRAGAPARRLVRAWALTVRRDHKTAVNEQFALATAVRQQAAKVATVSSAADPTTAPVTAVAARPLRATTFHRSTVTCWLGSVRAGETIAYHATQVASAMPDAALALKHARRHRAAVRERQVAVGSLLLSRRGRRSSRRSRDGGENLTDGSQRVPLRSLRRAAAARHGRMLEGGAGAISQHAAEALAPVPVDPLGQWVLKAMAMARAANASLGVPFHPGWWPILGATVPTAHALTPPPTWATNGAGTSSIHRCVF